VGGSCRRRQAPPSPRVPASALFSPRPEPGVRGQSLEPHDDFSGPGTENSLPSPYRIWICNSTPRAPRGWGAPAAADPGPPPGWARAVGPGPRPETPRPRGGVTPDQGPPRGDPGAAGINLKLVTPEILSTTSPRPRGARAW